MPNDIRTSQLIGPAVLSIAFSLVVSLGAWIYANGANEEKLLNIQKDISENTIDIGENRTKMNVLVDIKTSMAVLANDMAYVKSDIKEIKSNQAYFKAHGTDTTR
mgnify:CR=1 FL=1